MPRPLFGLSCFRIENADIQCFRSANPQERAAFDLNFDISERIYQIIQKKGMTKRDLARLTGKKESEVSRWFMLGHNFTCKTIAMIQLALGEKIVEVAK